MISYTTLKRGIFAAGLTALVGSHGIAQNVDVRSEEDLHLLVAAKEVGVNMPSQEALSFYGLTGADRKALSQIVRTGGVNLFDRAQQSVYMKAIRPAIYFINKSETETLEDVVRSGVDMAAFRAAQSFAYEMITAVGSYDRSIGSGACVIDVAFPVGFDVAVQGGSDTFSKAFVASGRSINGGAAGYLVIANECRPDKNDLICAPSDDVLTSDACNPMTDKYCRLTTPTGGGNVRKCTAASDDP